jgi:hypothetical protein
MNGMVLFGETHVGDARKARFFADLVQNLAGQQSIHTHFHATERLFADPDVHTALQDYLAASPPTARERSRLPEVAQRFLPLLEAARQYPNQRYAILPANAHVDDADARHAAIHGAFNASLERHNRLFASRPIHSATSKGHFLIGSFHASRRHEAGTATPTTGMLLVQNGWTLHVVRTTVNVVGGMTASGAITAGEHILLAPLGSTATFPDEPGVIDLLPALNRVAGGSPFIADIRGQSSPFGQVKILGRADIPYNELFDAILHLP